MPSAGLEACANAPASVCRAAAELCECRGGKLGAHTRTLVATDGGGVNVTLVEREMARADGARAHACTPTSPYIAIDLRLVCATVNNSWFFPGGSCAGGRGV